jgi:hypothetical protein
MIYSTWTVGRVLVEVRYREPRTELRKSHAQTGSQLAKTGDYTSLRFSFAKIGVNECFQQLREAPGPDAGPSGRASTCQRPLSFLSVPCVTGVKDLTSVTNTTLVVK